MQADIDATLELCHSGNEPCAGQWQDDVEAVRLGGENNIASCSFRALSMYTHRFMARHFGGLSDEGGYRCRLETLAAPSPSLVGSVVIGAVNQDVKYVGFKRPFPDVARASALASSVHPLGRLPSTIPRFEARSISPVSTPFSFCFAPSNSLGAPQFSTRFVELPVVAAPHTIPRGGSCFALQSSRSRPWRRAF